MKGFSLLELLVVVVLIGGMLLIAIPTLGPLTGANTRSEIRTLSGLVSECYNRAALSGKTHRLVIDLDNDEYFVQEKSLDAASFLPELGHEIELETKKDDEDKDFKPQFVKVEGDLQEKMKLKSSLNFFGVWSEGLNEPLREGIAAIYFFPSGYAQNAFISLGSKKDNEAQMYLAISPLTGEVSTGNGEPKIEDLLEKNSETNN